MATKKTKKAKKEKDLDQMHTVQRDILQHLHVHGPAHLDTFYVLFDMNHTGRVNAAIADLIKWKGLYVDHDPETKKVSITKGGLKRLEEHKF